MNLNISITLDELLTNPAMLAMANELSRLRQESHYQSEQLSLAKLRDKAALAPAPVRIHDRDGEVVAVATIKTEIKRGCPKMVRPEKSAPIIGLKNSILDALADGSEKGAKELAEEISSALDRNPRDIQKNIGISLCQCAREGFVTKVGRGLYKIIGTGRKKDRVKKMMEKPAKETPEASGKDDAMVHAVKEAIRDGARFRIDIAEKTGLDSATIDSILKNSKQFVRGDEGWSVI